MPPATALDAALEVVTIQQGSLRMLGELCQALSVRCDALEIRLKALEDERR